MLSCRFALLSAAGRVREGEGGKGGTGGAGRERCPRRTKTRGRSSGSALLATSPVMTKENMLQKA